MKIVIDELFTNGTPSGFVAVNVTVEMSYKPRESDTFAWARICLWGADQFRLKLAVDTSEES